MKQKQYRMPATALILRLATLIALTIAYLASGCEVPFPAPLFRPHHSILTTKTIRSESELRLRGPFCLLFGQTKSKQNKIQMPVTFLLKLSSCQRNKSIKNIYCYLY